MFTLAVPVYDDFDALACCLVANLQQPHVSGAVVVDNNPKSRQGEMTAGLCRSLGIKYVPVTEAVGTAAAKNRAIRECPSGRVICLDSHVILMAGATTAAGQFFDEWGDAHLVQGPLVLDNLRDSWTHFCTTWTPDRVETERARLRNAGHGLEKASDVVVGHQLWSEGMWGQWDTDREALAAGRPFDIPSMGMGCFATHTELWQGFNDGMRGFGGEEGYIHEKYRKAGFRTVCVPGFRWWHKFGRGQPLPHRVLIADKFRNYLIGFKELGLDDSSMRRHFALWLPPHEYHTVMDGTYDPSRQVSLPAAQSGGCGACGGVHPLAQFETLELATAAAAKIGSDINEHVLTLRDLSKKCDRVLDVGSRLESSLALAWGRLYHHAGTLGMKDRQTVHGFRKEEVTAPPLQELPRYDLVFIDTDPHDAEPVYQQLEQFGLRSDHHIVLHDTVTYGPHGSSGPHVPGVLAAVQRFVQTHKEWTVVRHDRNNNGLLVLSCKIEDKKSLPSLWQQGVNAFKASWRAGTNVLTKDGPLKDTPAHDRRLALCLLCPSLTDGKCAECACPVDKKTQWPTESCPLGHWTTEAAS